MSSELANALLADLRKAAKKGESFSLVTGEPDSWAQSAETVFSVVRAYMRATVRRRLAGNTVRTVRDACVLVVMACIDDQAVRRSPAPGEASDAAVRSMLHRALAYRFDATATRPDRQVLDPVGLSDDDRALVGWLDSVSLPIGSMDADAAGAVVQRLAVRVGGGAPLSPDTVRRRRGVWSSVLDHAVAGRLLSSNPLVGVKVESGTRARSTDAVNPVHIPDPEQCSRLLGAVADRDPFLWAFFAVCFLAGLRPGEARAVREQDITWPENIRSATAARGFGMLTLQGSRTEDGEDASLKHRGGDDVRLVPLPPEAVEALREHLEAFGTAPDGRLWWHATSDEGEFGTLRGAAYRAAWARARRAALTLAERESGLARRPYDLRHACASMLMYGGLPTPEIARRLGHTVEVLLTIYTHWLNTGVDEANQKLAELLEKLGPLTGQKDATDA